MDAMIARYMTTPLSGQDLAYVNQVAQSGNAEIQLGQLAEQQTANEAVGVFGRWMSLDHSVLNAAVATAVSPDGITTPTSLSASGAAAVTTLQNLTGTAFEQQYLANEVQSHVQTIFNTETEINQGSDPALVGEANAALPLFQAHLASAITIGLASSLGAADAQAAPTTILGQSIASIGNESAQAIVAVTHALTAPQNGALDNAVMSFLSQPPAGAAATGPNPFSPGTSDAALAQTAACVTAGAQVLISIANELTAPQGQGLGNAILGVLAQPQYLGLEGAVAGFLSNPTGGDQRAGAGGHRQRRRVDQRVAACRDPDHGTHRSSYRLIKTKAVRGGGCRSGRCFRISMPVCRAFAPERAIGVTSSSPRVSGPEGWLGAVTGYWPACFRVSPILACFASAAFRRATRTFTCALSVVSSSFCSVAVSFLLSSASSLTNAASNSLPFNALSRSRDCRLSSVIVVGSWTLFRCAT